MYRLIRNLTLGVAAAALFLAGAPGAVAADQKTLRVLFIGNSFTGRHNLSQVVKAMAEAGDPNLHFEVATVIYGGRTLRDHWRLGTQNYVQIATLTPAAERATITDIRFLDATHKDQDRDGGPLRRTFSARERADLQRLAWEGLQEFRHRADSPEKADKG